MKPKYIAVAFILATGASAWAVTPNIAKGREAEASHWADSVYNTLTTRQRVAQLVVAGVNPGGQGAEATVRKVAATEGCGGMLFNKSTLREAAAMSDLGRDLAKVPLLMTLDGEWGLSMRIKDTPVFPRNMALGAIQDTRLLYDYGREVARECKLMGINVDFAPVADVNTNPANPVIGDRSFGENTERVAKAVTAYSLGLESGGVQAVAKHFPGHGDTDSDSHKTLPTVNHSRQALDSIDLAPFRAFINAGGSGIMVGHLNVPVIDKSGTPTSLSYKAVTELLRKDMGFEGLIYTDGLGMKGATVNGNPSVAALAAGADVLLYPTDAQSTINVVLRAVESGKISKKTLEDRCKRVLRYKYLLDAGHNTQGSIRQLSAAINSPEASALIKRLAAASITVIKNKNDILPLGNLGKTKIAIVNIGARGDNDFANTCSLYADVATYFTMGESFSATTLAKINKADVVIAAVYKDSPAARTVFAGVVEGNPRHICVFMTNPYKLSNYAEALKNVDATIVAYEDIPAERVSAAEAIFGGIAVDGRLPVSIKGVAKEGAEYSYAKSRLGISSPIAEGMAPWLTDSLDATVAKALKDKAFPGCQVLVARNGNIVYDKSFGRLSGAESAAVDANTIYDLASVSKATGTLSGIMKAYDMGLLNLEMTLGDLIPEIADSAKRSITVRELLYHETGMPASLNMFDAMIDSTTFSGKLITRRPDKTHSIKIQRNAYGNNSARLRSDILRRTADKDFATEASKGIFTGKVTFDTIMHRIYNIGLRDDKSYNYSCLNFCLLMDIEQRLTSRPHNEFVGEEIFAPLGAYRTGYRPLEWTSQANIAPTEHDTFLRRQTLHGYVHDELANFSGGVQGNAGLFSNARDIAKYCQMLLNGGTYGDTRLLSESTARLFTTDKSPTCRRGLGFDKPDMENPDWSPTCDEAAPTVFGHLGFTGTVFWVDPAQNLIFVFLTNRVYPTRDNAAFSSSNIRPHLFSLVCRSLE